MKAIETTTPSLFVSSGEVFHISIVHGKVKNSPAGMRRMEDTLRLPSWEAEMKGNR